ncbi:condensation domain-containing protein [Actinocrinis sp.]|uniref:condensation domain-containing protein n=1 Tax=Actinocrinis sp. TaxID=1920516 RepID=UPI002D51CBB1|nr:condensation domain-containing protein [Actinocrinis sp.]HZP54324.1 condensation domain-containing protein [Actinocrinis sp.]
MAITLSDIRVRFEGHGAGVGELTWGQLGILRTTRRTGRTMNVVVTMPLPEATPLTEMTAVLRFLVSRHPALRTRLRFADGPSGERGVQQVVADSGEIPLYIADLDDEDDPSAAAEQMRSRFELEWFDYEREFPVRMGVVRQSGTLVRLVLGYSHVMVDGAGILALTRDLANLDRVTGQATAPPDGVSPLDVAAAQDSASGRRQSERSIRYWAAQLERLSAWQPAEPASPQQPRFWELAGYSPAMDLALREIAARTGAATTYVLLAAYSTAVARVFGRNPSVAQIVVSNRFRPGFADVAAQLSQEGICVVDTAAASFDEVVDRAQSAATSASFYGYYDPGQCARLLDETAARRGGPLEISWHLNDRRAIPASQRAGESDAGGVKRDDQAGSDVPVDEALAKLLPRTRLFWDRRMPSFDGTLFIQVDSAPAPLASRQALPEGLPAVYFEVWADTQVFTTARIEEFARAMEAVLVEAACDA